jgi:acetyltransferase-like isoleucine patch superfamily enzyme
MKQNRHSLAGTARKALTAYPRALRAFEALCAAYGLGFRAPVLLLKTLYYARYGDIVVHPNTHITGARWLSVQGRLTVGKRFRLLMHPADQTMVDLRGDLRIRGDVLIGKGCRIWVGEGAHCILEDCFLSANALATIRHGLTIGAGSAISWDCRFLDDDWHTLDYPGKRVKPMQITIGKRVWMGSNVSVLKGVTVGNGCVVAAGSVLTGAYPANCLIGGNPARVLKENVAWGGPAAWPQESWAEANATVPSRLGIDNPRAADRFA